MSDSCVSSSRLPADFWRLFAARFVRLFAYGFLSVVLVLYLKELKFSDRQVGSLLMLTLLGDTAVSLWLTSRADRLGRRRMLLVGAFLMALAGCGFASTTNFWLLLVAATLGVISPSGNEVGPFLSIEQAALTQIVPAWRRTAVFAWYQFVGSLATALGAQAGGTACHLAASGGLAGADVYRPVILGYAVGGALLAAIFWRLSPTTEIAPAPAAPLSPHGWKDIGLGRSRGIVFRLAGLFAIDAFGGGFIIQSVLAYWFHTRYGLEPLVLGNVFLWLNVLAGLSSLVAAWLAKKLGLINTMVFTHLPSNVLLILVPLMPSLPWALALLMVRFSISQMDVPARQSYTMAVVAAEERSAASGVTAVARSVGAALSPMLAQLCVGIPALASLPFYLAGGIKIVYDLLLYRAFIGLKPLEEEQEPAKRA
jgi:MFS family permease